MLENVKELDAAYLARTYARNDLVLERGSGCTAWSGDAQYLDFTSGIGVNSLGFCDEAWTKAVCAQVQTLQHTSNLYYTAPGEQLAETLCARTGLRRVFFANSGAEANECAIKVARKYASDTYGAGRHRILTLENSFHGRTMATLSATGQAVFHKHFDPFLDGFTFLPANDVQAFQAAADDTVCAVLLELIQGEGGVLPLDAAYVQAVAAHCAAHDILLMVDEVQTGVGRTGKFLTCEHFGLQPDVVTLAKGLGGGLPIGAALFSEKCADTLGAGDHGSTFGMNPVVCAGANAVLERLTPAFLQDVCEKGEALERGLRALPHVTDVSGRGLMLGIQFDEGIAAKEVLARAQDRGLLCLTAKTRLRLLPPLIVTQKEIDAALAILRGVLEEMI